MFASALHSVVEEPDYRYWERCFPRGVGASAFSSPAWFRQMVEVTRRAWTPKFIRVDGPEGPLTLPVLSRSTRVGRQQLQILPPAYYATPLEKATLSEAEVAAVTEAFCTWKVCSFTWWLPPWATGIESRAPIHRGASRFSIDHIHTFLIDLQERAEDHMKHRVSAMHRRYARKNKERGLELVRDPDPSVRAAYCDLYEQVHVERGWVGASTPRCVFDGVVEELGDGGELVVATQDGRVIGGGILLYDRHAVHYLQGAIDRDARDVRPHVALYEHALKEAEARGLSRVNLGGVNDGNHGLVRFKQSWGAQATPVPRIRWKCSRDVVLSRLGWDRQAA